MLNQVRLLHNDVFIHALDEHGTLRGWIGIFDVPAVVLGPTKPDKHGELLNRDNYNISIMHSMNCALKQDKGLIPLYFLLILNGAQRRHVLKWLAHIADEELWRKK